MVKVGIMSVVLVGIMSVVLLGLILPQATAVAPAKADDSHLALEVAASGNIRSTSGSDATNDAGFAASFFQINSSEEHHAETRHHHSHAKHTGVSNISSRRAAVWAASIGATGEVEGVRPTAELHDNTGPRISPPLPSAHVRHDANSDISLMRRHTEKETSSSKHSGGIRAFAWHAHSLMNHHSKKADDWIRQLAGTPDLSGKEDIYSTPSLIRSAALAACLLALAFATALSARVLAAKLRRGQVYPLPAEERALARGKSGDKEFHETSAGSKRGVSCGETSRPVPEAHSFNSVVRTCSRTFPLCSCESDLLALLPDDGSYDCVHPRPLRAREPVRLHATVAGPILNESVLAAPLTKQACVFFSAQASQRMTDVGLGSPVTVAFSRGYVDFVAVLTGSPNVSVEVCGADVALIDMRAGHLVEQTRVLAASPAHWQDFARSGANSSSASGNAVPGSAAEAFMGTAAENGAAPLQFEECALHVGAKVVLIGELQRDPGGKLSLQPMSRLRRKSDKQSDVEHEDDVDEHRDEDVFNVHVRKVLVSDDPEFALV